MNILFSPIGMTDPISKKYDGAMLHICRYYDIDKVYMYMSKEIYEKHLSNNRYVYCLERLGELKGKKIDYELIIREELTEVQIFDFFLSEYETLLNNIHQQYPEAELYLNVSSGTPAMKNALQNIPALVNFRTNPIQCRTPENKSNSYKVLVDDFDPELLWETDDDNSNNINRCSKSEYHNFIIMLKKNILEELIRKYDYIGAKSLVSENMGLNSRFTELLDAACERYMLRFSVSNGVFKKYGFTIAENELTNYLRCLDLKVKKGEYADFIRAITPLIVDLFEDILASDYCGNFMLKNYTTVNKFNVVQWDKDKLAEYAPDVLSALNKGFYNNFRGGDISSKHLVKIIAHLSSDQKLVDICEKLRSVEGTVRNITAHEIVSINDDSIYRKTGGFYSKDIVKLLFDAMCYTKNKQSEDFFDSYDKMNDLLIDSLYDTSQ
ncbi:MAG: hypothetical protein J6A37_10810 [Oscillospiraceae bacterium]|nr:hypothetical protein [Oscillospiraceae bacterium]